MDQFKYEIVATLGPSSDQPASWNALLASGATAFRLNTSHLTVRQVANWLASLNYFFTTFEFPVPVVLDLQGSKWRLGQFSAFELVTGQKVKLVLAPTADQPGILPVPHADFFRAALQSSGEIILNDAKNRLHLESSTPESAIAQVVQGGLISANKGITFSSSTYRTETLSEKDQAIVSQSTEFGWVRYAISYIKDAGEMARFRQLIAPSAYLIAKLERAIAMVDAVEIAKSSSELWVCRGDLGAEVGLVNMAVSVNQFSNLIDAIPIPVLMAGQVLEHMTGQATPTRSEICYLYDSLLKGYRGVVLSDETAIGRDPIEAVRTAALFKTTGSGSS